MTKYSFYYLNKIWIHTVKKTGKIFKSLKSPNSRKNLTSIIFIKTVILEQIVRRAKELYHLSLKIYFLPSPKYSSKRRYGMG
jgi:hypothetical protein